MTLLRGPTCTPTNLPRAVAQTPLPTRRYAMVLGFVLASVVPVMSAWAQAQQGIEAHLSVAQPEQTLSAADAALLAEYRLRSAPQSAPLQRAPSATFTCNGAGGPWSAPGTWSPSGPPTAADDVTISAGCNVVVDTAAAALSLNIANTGALEFDSAVARTLTISGSATIATGGSLSTAATGAITAHVLSIGGDLSNNGTLDLSTNGNTAGAGLVFTNPGSNSFSGTGATTNLRTLTINKGTSSGNVLELSTSNFTVQGTSVDGAPMAFLTLTNGTLKVSGTFTLAGRVFAGAAGYTIPATAGFWLNNPNFTVSGQAGSPTNNGLLRVSSGTYNIGTGSGNSMGAGTAAIFTIDGGTINLASRMTSASTFVTYTQSAGVVNVNTVGNTSTSPSFGFTGTTGVVMNMSGGAINLVQASTAATPVDYNQAGTMNFTGGTLNVGTAATATNFVFRVQGQMPNVVIDNSSNNKTANLSGQGNVWGNLTINTGTTLNLNPGTAQTLLMIGPTITNNGAIIVNTNNTSTVNFAGGLQTVGAPYAQTYTGTGTLGAAALRIASFSVQSPLGVALTSVNNLNIYRINAFYGSITNADKLANGNGDATAMVIQRGASGAFSAGTLDVAPTANVGSGGLALVYSQSATNIVTGPEVPVSRSALSIQMLNATGVTLAGGPLTTTGATTGLVLGSGVLTTSATNLLTLSNTATTAVNGGSGTSYVDGPLARALPASLASAATYTFPLGKNAFKMLELVNPTTNAGGTVVVQAEVFDAGSGGTAGTGLSAINGNRYWSAEITSGAANFTNATVRLTEAATPTVSAIGQSATLGGAYNSIGGAVVAPVIGPSSVVTTLGFFAVGTLTGTTPICGNFNVGAGGDFTTLTAAVAALNSREMTCAVSFTLTDNLYAGETYPITINANAGASAVNTLTIKPAPGATPAFSGSASSALLIMNGADYVTIDGSNVPGGSGRNLSFTNTNVGTSSAVIWGQTVGANDPASNNTLRNLIIAGNAGNTTLAGIGFGSSTIGTASLGTRNNNNRVENNLITSVQIGVYSQGASTNIKNTGIVISANELGGAGALGLGRTGIYVGFDDGVQITNNMINGVSGSVASADAFGIALGSIAVSNTGFGTNNDVANAIIRGNVIGPVIDDSDFATIGISLANNNYGTTRIANNVVHSVRGSGTAGDFCAGIFIGNSGSTTALTEVWYNSVSITGNRDQSAVTNQPAFALAILGANPLVDLRNNSLVNTSTAPTNGATTAGSYAIGLSSTLPLTKFTSNHNDLYSSGAASHFAMLGSLTNIVGDQLTLAAWRTATGKDANSISADPLYTSSTVLLPTLGSPLSYAGTPVPVTVDITGAPRSATLPTIGAYEFGANLTITPAALNFGAQAVGSSSAELTVTLANTGNIGLDVTALTAAAAPFARTATGSCSAGLPIALGAGASCTLTFTYSPTAAGPASQNLTVTANAPGSGTIALSGNGTQGVLTVAPTSIDFGNQNVGSTSAESTITLGNTGNAALTVTTLTAAAVPFARAGGSCSAVPISIAAGGSCTVTYTFTPAAAGPFNQVLQVQSAAPGSTTITLQGTGVAGALAVSPNPLEFGNQLVGTTSGALTATLSNPGAGSVDVTALPAPSAPFARTGGSCAAAPFTLNSGASCTVLYTFSPTAAGPASLSIVITNSVGGPVSLVLNGTGTQGALTITPSAVAFGNQTVGTTSAASTVTLANTGTAALDVTALTAAATPFARAGGSCSAVPITIAAGANCTLTYTFAPTATGAANQTLTVTANAPGSGTIALSGSGVQGNLTITPTSIAFGNQNVGTTSAASTVTLANTGNASLDVTALTAAAAPFARLGGTCSAVPITIAAGGSCTLTYTFAPTASGAANQTLTVTANAPGSGAIALSGTGTPSADLSITKTVNEALIGSGMIQYTVTAANAGPSPVTGATVTDTFPAQLSGATWTCSGLLGGSCTASGSGNISQSVNLPVGGSVVFSITASIVLPLPASISNTATVAVPAGTTDPNLGNNSAAVTTVILLFANGFEDVPPSAPEPIKLGGNPNGAWSGLALPLDEVRGLAVGVEPTEVIRFQVQDSLVVVQTRSFGGVAQARLLQINAPGLWSVSAWSEMDQARGLSLDWSAPAAGLPQTRLRPVR